MLPTDWPLYQGKLVLAALLCLGFAAASPLVERSSQCRKAEVAIIGAGMAGITAAQALSNASVHDFLVIEYRGEIGGRVAHTTFGNSSAAKAYTVELGANWVQGLQTGDGPENPIWFLAQKYQVKNTYSNYSSIKTFTDKGRHDYSSLLNDYSHAYSIHEQDAGHTLISNLLDTSVRSGLSLVGWTPKKDMMAQAVEWWSFDWEYSYTPEQSSALWSVVNYNTTFYQYSADNSYVYDPRGFNTIIKGEASTFLHCSSSTPILHCNDDKRLLLNTKVTKIAHNNTGVTITNADGSCITASYAILTVSLGVLQNDVITFSPPFPDWKQSAIATFQMGTYTKLFLQFPPDKVFWDKQTQFFLYADPVERGYYPVWQSLDGPGFLPGSGIFFATVVGYQSYRAEAQDDATVKAQVMAVLRNMYGAKNVPEPIAFMYPRWSLEEWVYGSYSNWPPGTTLEQHQNLRANLGRLYFAGEATSTEYYGFLQGAWFEGREAGQLIAGCLNGSGKCPGMENYPVLHGTQQISQYNEGNGWMVQSTGF